MIYIFIYEDDVDEGSVVQSAVSGLPSLVAFIHSNFLRLHCTALLQQCIVISQQLKRERQLRAPWIECCGRAAPTSPRIGSEESHSGGWTPLKICPQMCQLWTTQQQICPRKCDLMMLKHHNIVGMVTDYGCLLIMMWKTKIAWENLHQTIYFWLWVFFQVDFSLELSAIQAVYKERVCMMYILGTKTWCCAQNIFY